MLEELPVQADMTKDLNDRLTVLEEGVLALQAGAITGQAQLSALQEGAAFKQLQLTALQEDDLAKQLHLVELEVAVNEALRE
jgi:hypothetical protein